MAVEIPVYVDIKGGIDRAVNELPNDMKSLERAVGKNALNLRFQVDKKGYDATVRELLTSTKFTAKELHTALSNVRAEFEDAMLRNAGQKRVTAEVNNLIRAYTALEQRLYGVKNNFTASMMSTENAIARVKAKIKDLTNQRSNYYQDETPWQNLTYQIRLQEEKLSRLNTQLEIYRIKSKNAGKAAKTSISEANSAYSKQLGLIGQLTGALASYVSIFGLMRFAQQVRDVTGELEYQRVALGRLIQDEEYGAQLFERIKAAAVESPFRIKDLVTYTKQLAAYKIEQEDLFDVTKRLADISAGLGVDMNRIILAYGQVRAASVLRGQELRQFTEAGIPLVELLADKFSELRDETVKTSDVFKLISRRAVPFSMIADIFEDLTEKGGMFYQMQEKQAKTLQGRWEKLKDTYDIALQKIGETESFQKANDRVLESLNKLAQHLNAIPKTISAITTATITYVAVMKAVDIWNKRYLIQDALIQASLIIRALQTKKLTVIQALQIVQSNLLAKAEAKLAVATNAASKAFAKLTISMLKNPWVAAIAGIAGLITMLVSFEKTSNAASDSALNLDKTITKFHETTKDVSRLEKLIDKYEFLANKTERTEEETRKLSKTIKSLQEAYPNLTFSIDDDTKAIKNNTDAMAANNKKRLELIKERAEEDLGLARVNLENYERDREKINAKYLEKRRTMRLYQDEEGERREMTRLEEKVYDKLTKEANELKEQLDSIDEEINKTTHDIERLEDKLYPKQEMSKAWREQLQTMQLASDGSEIFSKEQLDNWTRLYDVSTDLEKEWKRVKEDLDAMRESADKADPKFLEEWGDDIANLESKLAGLEFIKSFFGFIWGKQDSKTGYQKDPFITKMENWIKFMKDFRSGYDDLKKYMSEQGALDKQFGIMEARGLSMGISPEEQKRAATDLSKWYEDTAKKAFAEAKKHGATGSMASFLSQQISDTTNNGKTLRAFQELIQSLFDAKTDFDTSQMKEDVEKSLKKLTEDIKRTETARNFYKNILDLAGDENLAENLTVSVYGSVGKDFKERIQEELYRALTEIEPENINNDLMSQIMGDITIFDIDDISKNLDKLPPKVREVFEKALEDNQKFNADWLVDFEKTYAKAASYGARVARLEKQREQKEEEARQMGKSPEEVARVTEYYNQKIADVQLEAMKDTYTWTKAFEDLGGVSSRTLDNLIGLIDEYISKYGKDLEPQQLKELTRAREQAQAQKIERNGFVGIVDAITKLASKRKDINMLEKRGIKTEEAATMVADGESKAILQLAESYEELMSEMNGYMSSAKDLISVFASDEDASFFGGLLDNLSQTMGGVGKAGAGILGIIANPANTQAWMQALTGLADIVAGIFSGISAAKLREINKQIEAQQKKVEALDRSYQRLEKAMAKAFGSDYIYNYTKQLENLQAKVDAYNKQADLETSKGKKADKNKIQEYKEAAEDAAEEIAEMNGQLAEFFTGTDVTSAAKDFANSWIEAYKEFGSTTSAMKEKFQDLIQSMVEQSIGAKIMQSILQPLFDSIDEMAKEGGELSAQEIAQIAQSTPEYIDKINNAMTNMMNQLTAAGYNMRQGVGQFTGISRDIAGASEESITGLAAGINTQNFYMSLISQNVAAILATLTGGAEVTGVAGAAAPEDPYKKSMLEFVGFLPQMHDDMYAVRQMLEKVIKPNGTASTHYVATRS